MPNVASKRCRTASPWAGLSSSKKRQQTLTQIQFVPRRPSPISDSDLLDHKRLSSDDMPPPASRLRNRTRHDPSRAEIGRTSTITQMDFLSRPSTSGISDDEFNPIEVHKCTKKRKPSARPNMKTATKTWRRRPSEISTAGGGAGDPSIAGISRGSENEINGSPGDPTTPVNGPHSQLSNVVSTFRPTIETKHTREDLISSRRTLREIEDWEELGFTIYEDSAGLPLPSIPRTPISTRTIPSSQTPESLPPSSNKGQLLGQGIPISPRSPLGYRPENESTPTKGTKITFKPLVAGKGQQSPAKSKMVILPIALTSQGAVSRGDALTKSQWPLLRNSPSTRSTLISTARKQVIPSSDDEEDSEVPSFDDVTTTRAANMSSRLDPNLTAPNCLANRPPNPAAKTPLKQQGHYPGLRLTPENENDEEPPFSPGTPIESSSPPQQPLPQAQTRRSSLHHRNGEIVLPTNEHLSTLHPTLARSDSEAAAAQLHSMLHNITQVTPGSCPPGERCTLHLPPSQISTQDPTQETPRRTDASSRNAALSSPSKVFIKPKSSSSVEIPMDDITRHPQSSPHDLEAIDASDVDYLETDDLNPSTYRRRDIEIQHPESLLAKHAGSPVPPRKTKQTSMHKLQRQDPNAIASSLCSASRLVIQDSTCTSDPETLSPLQTPQEVISFQPDVSPSWLQNCSQAKEDQFEKTDDILSSQASPGHHRFPLSSSPITKGAHWTIPDSLMESLPGPPPGWHGYPIVEGETRKL